MDWEVPGTALKIPREEAAFLPEQFRAMFMAGDMVLSQVSNLTGLESYIIQNWVKRGFLSKPRNKRYTLRQLCRIMNINMLKGVMPLEQICSLLGYVNGRLDDEQDDTIDDSDLYFMFIRLAARSRELYQAQSRDAVLEEELADYTEPVPGAKARVKAVLRIMLTAWLAARMSAEAGRMLKELEIS